MSFKNLDDCLSSPVDCKNEMHIAMQATEEESRDWFLYTYYYLSASWQLDSLSISEDELAKYAAISSSPDVFKIVVYTIYAKKLLNKGDHEKGAMYAQKASDKIFESTDVVPDPRRLAELIILHHYLKDYKKSRELAKWAMEKTEQIGNARAKVELYVALGHDAWFAKDYVTAKKYYSQVVQIFESFGDELQLAYGAVNLGMVYLREEDFNNARKYFVKAEKAMTVALGDYPGKDISYIKLRLVDLECKEQQWQAAADKMASITPEQVHAHHQGLYDDLQAQIAQHQHP